MFKQWHGRVSPSLAAEIVSGMLYQKKTPLTWIKCVDFGKFLFTGLKKFFFKLGKIPLYCVLICNWKQEKQYLNLMSEGHLGKLGK